MNVVELFPTKIALFKLPAELSTVCNYFNEVPMEVDKFPSTHSKERDANFLNYGLHSKDTYIMDGDECKEISKFVLECVDKYNYDVLGYVTDGWQFSQSWVSFKYPGQQHIEHTHPNSIISGVFYINCHESLDKITFFDEKYKAIKPKIKDFNLFNSESWWFPVTTGDIFLFPSSLAHMVETKQGKNTRISLSFNVFIKGTVGSDRDLTELILD